MLVADANPMSDLPYQAASESWMAQPDSIITSEPVDLKYQIKDKSGKHRK